MKNETSENAIRGAIETLCDVKCGVRREALFKFSAITEKDVVDLGDGRIVGRVSDVTLECGTGRIESLTVPLSHKPFEKCGYVDIPWKCVVCVGRDTVIVRMPDKK